MIRVDVAALHDLRLDELGLAALSDRRRLRGIPLRLSLLRCHAVLCGERSRTARFAPMWGGWAIGIVRGAARVRQPDLDPEIRRSSSLPAPNACNPRKSLP